MRWLLLATAVVACTCGQGAGAGNCDHRSGDRRADAADVDLVEYVFREESQGRRILLTTEGAARVDFRRGVGQHRRVRAVLLPTDPKEVERLVRAVSALIDSGAATPVTVRELQSGTEGTFIRCRKAGRERVVRIYSEFLNFVWEGVRKEIDTVASLELASAVDAYEDAGSRAKGGDRDGAIQQYDNAIKAFMAWAELRCDRYGPWAIFEPTVTLSVPIPTNPGATIEITGSPERCKDWPWMTPELAIDFLPHAWKECTEGMTLSRSGTAVIVSFAESKPADGWTWGLPLRTIPADVAERLKAEKGAARKDECREGTKR